MDLIAAKLGANMAINSLAESGQVGSVKKPVYTFNGDVAGKVHGENFVYISSDTPDLNDIIEATAIFNGQEVKIEKAHIEITEQSGVLYAMSTAGGSPIAIAAIIKGMNTPEMPDGLWFTYSESGTIMGYVASITFAETVKPIDPKFLGTSATKILDLTQFACTYNDTQVTFNDVVGTLLTESAYAGGGLKTADAIDVDGKLRAAASGNGNLVTQFALDAETIIDMPMIFAHSPNGKAGQIAGVGLMKAAGGVMDMKMYIQFFLNATTVNVGVYVMPVT